MLFCAQRHAWAGAHRVTITAIVVDAILAGGVVARAWSGYLAVLVGRILRYRVLRAWDPMMDIGV